MNCLQLKMFFLVAMFCVFASHASARTITYLDENYKPANPVEYTYKRVVKFKESVMNPNLSVNPYPLGGFTARPTRTGLYICSVTDYYDTGEPALVTNGLASDLTGSYCAFDGEAVFYYKNGSVKWKGVYDVGKQQDWWVTYREDGTELIKELYQGGILIKENKFRTPSNSPLVGTWKLLTYEKSWLFPDNPPRVVQTDTATYYQNSIFEHRWERIGYFSAQGSSGTSYGNWRYLPQDRSSGIEELYRGDELIMRGTIKWINRNQFEYTTTFNPNTASIGKTVLWTRQ